MRKRLILATGLLAIASAMGGCGPVDEDEDGFERGVDCDDLDPEISPDAEEIPYDGVDNDCDGFDITDADGDGYLATEVGGLDCVDDDPTAYPGADEVPYDGVDNDCSGSDLTDLDNDGFDGGPEGDDCDDVRPDVNPAGVEICGDSVDQDCSGEDLVCSDIDVDGDGYSPATGDCNEMNPGINPGAMEIPYNGVDEDCSLDTPDDDLDGDGFGRRSGGDCDDTDATVFPGADEVPYDGVDQDCSGSDLVDVDRDGYEGGGGPDCDDVRPDVSPAGVDVCGDGIDQDCSGADLACSTVDMDGDGFSPAMGDCNDGDPAIGPGATETPYNGVDDDCDVGTPDDDLDGDGFRSLAGGGGDCDDADPSVRPGATEIPYDGVDQDCSGADLTDVDLDGFDGGPSGADCNDTRADINPASPDVCGDGIDQDCSGADLSCGDVDGDGDGYTPNAGDCVDTDATVNPGATEVPYNGLDDDCDPATRDDDLDMDGFGAVLAGGADCDDADASVRPGATEIAYDGVDQDCSGADLTDRDGDGFDGGAGGADCDDLRADVSPIGVDVCGDGVDQDCMGGDLSCSAVDMDGDGFTPSMGDCNDAAPSINPGVLETPYNGVDDDCDPMTPDDDLDGDGFTQVGGGDCDDADATVFPSATETPYDGVDQDCSGADLVDVDGDGYDGGGGPDCDDLDTSVNPGRVEIPYDGTDQDCDGDDTIGNPTTIDTTDSYEPDVAFNGTHYLVVWRDYDPMAGYYGVRGQRVANDGTLVGSAFAISTSTTQAYEPAVSSDGTNFLVVYRGYTPSSSSDIWAQRVAADGSLLGAELPVSSTTSYEEDPDVAYGAGTYLVTYRGYDSMIGRYTAVATAVSAMGSVGPASYFGTTAPDEDIYYRPEVASNGTGFLVAFTLRGAVTSYRYRTYAQRVSAAGLPVGARVAVSDRSDYQYWPSVASDGRDYLVVWRDQDGGAYNIFGQMVSGADGSLLHTTASNNLPISTAVGTQDYPTVAFIDGAYSVAWNDRRFYTGSQYALYTQRVASDSSLIGTGATTNAPLIADGTNYSYPRLTSGGASGYVVYYSSDDVYGSLVTP